MRKVALQQDFNDGSADAMTVQQGSFVIENSRYNSTPSNSNERALTVIDLAADILQRLDSSQRLILNLRWA